MSTADKAFVEGQKALQRGALDEAAKFFAGALQADHQHLRASIALVRLSLRLSLSEQADAILQRTLAFASDQPEVTILVGLLQEGRGLVDQALDSYEKAAMLDPRQAEAHYQRGRLLAALGRCPEAVAALETAISLEPAATAALYVLAIARQKAGQTPQAIAALTRSIEVDPYFLDGYMTLADLLSAVEKQEMAEKVLLQAQSIFPDSGQVCDKLAAVYLKQGKLSKTVQALRDQVRVEPENGQAYVNLATFAMGAGDLKSASEAIEWLLQRDSGNWQALHIRSMLYDMAGKPELAITDLRRATQSAPREWKPWNDLGMLMNEKVRSGQAAAAEAVEVLETACRLAPAGEPAAQFNLGLAYWNANRRDDARRALQQAVTAQRPGSDDPIVAHAREILQQIAQD